MRNILIFAGSSCPDLATSICSKLGTSPASVELSQFANGETSVKILTSIREKDVFVVQSGSSKINDSIMELLILISACKGSSANKITAVLPYFPYSRQSKKKSQRGSITARMLANLLNIAGVKHVITIDLHASQMQGFFKCPVDNLHAEPLISRWIRHNVPNWQEAVCVSKNAGGSKRVTSLADALKLNFGMITTDKKRGNESKIPSSKLSQHDDAKFQDESNINHPKNFAPEETSRTRHNLQQSDLKNGENKKKETSEDLRNAKDELKNMSILQPCAEQTRECKVISQQILYDGISQSAMYRPGPSRLLVRTLSTPTLPTLVDEDVEFTDERARDIIQGRLVHGHIVADDYPSPLSSSVSNSVTLERVEKTQNETSNSSTNPSQVNIDANPDGAEGISDDDEESFKNAPYEHMITLVGDVRNRTVLIIDDMIDKAGSWIAAAECVVKRGGAFKVLCIATHGLFGGNSLEALQECDCIDTIVVTNSFPISPEKVRAATKLVILDLSNLLSEAIRRNHYGESMSALFTHSFD